MCVLYVQAKTWDWWGCIPNIKACFTMPGTMEVFWDSPEAGHQALIKGYQVGSKWYS